MYHQSWSNHFFINHSLNVSFSISSVVDICGIWVNKPFIYHSLIHEKASYQHHYAHFTSTVLSMCSLTYVCYLVSHHVLVVVDPGKGNLLLLGAGRHHKQPLQIKGHQDILCLLFRKIHNFRFLVIKTKNSYLPPGCQVYSWGHKLRPETWGRETWPAGCWPSSWSTDAPWPSSHMLLSSAGCRYLPSTCRQHHMQNIRTWYHNTKHSTVAGNAKNITVGSFREVN